MIVAVATEIRPRATGIKTQFNEKLLKKKKKKQLKARIIDKGSTGC